MNLINKESRLILSRKYARAFFNVFKSSLSLDETAKIDNFISYFYQNRKAFFYLKLPLLENELKKKNFSTLLKKFHLNENFEKLVDLLIKDKRLFLVFSVLEFIVKIYKECSNIMDFKVISSHELTQQETDNIVKFLADKTGKKIYITTKVDPCLIAGLKIYSNTLGWEHSVAKQLNLLSQN